MDTPLSPPTPSEDRRAPRADAIRNHDRILCTARRLFDSQGVASVTMSAIADEAGIGKGTLYRHFPDKTELLLALIDHETAAMRQEITARLQECDSTPDALHWFADQALAFSRRNSSVLCEANNHSPAANLTHPSRVWWREVLMSWFSRHGSSLDPAYAADTVYMMLDAQTVWFQMSQGYDYEQIARNVHGLIDQLLR